MRKDVLEAFEIPQKEIDALFVLLLEVMADAQKSFQTLSQAFERKRERGNPVHDYLHYAILVIESGCEPALTDTLLEIAQKKVETEQKVTFRQTAQIILLRDVVPYIQTKPDQEQLLLIQSQICSSSLTYRLIPTQIPYPEG